MSITTVWAEEVQKRKRRRRHTLEATTWWCSEKEYSVFFVVEMKVYVVSLGCKR